jgi:hydroxymethylglutaryl-CoA reductase (NADPH)
MSTISSGQRVGVPRDRTNDWTDDAARKRQEFVRERTGVSLQHVPHYSFDPAITAGNVEQFLGVAQVPIPRSCGPCRAARGSRR